MKAILITAIMAVLFISTAGAQHKYGYKDHNRRIQQGAASGQLTNREYRHLKARQNALKMQAYRYKANDGRISPCEKRMLKKGERRLSKNIYKQKHDRQRRFI
ncbi:MAG TPA: hypothetical protein PKC39_01185 [Ferruginibacter sp.]|nr:hypothetical protein [Ferruginibacter sp.]HMP19546.1 hypothetical protein [Ferruginibacter sp.]